MQWLGERTVQDPRFAIATVEHVYYILLGRKVLEPPQDIEDPLFSAHRRAYRQQRALVEGVAEKFKQSNFNLKVAFKELALSEFYRADAPATLAIDPCRAAELDDVGVARLLTPEQVERKIAAVFGKPWGRLTDPESKFNILYGGIDSQEVTERGTDPSGAMGAIQRLLANDVACKNVALDFSRPAAERRLFPGIELTDVPPEDDKDDSQAEAKIREAIVLLHQHVLGRHHAPDDAEVDRTYTLFTGIISDARENPGWDKRGSYSCDRVDEEYLQDPNYTLRAWRGVVTYLLRQQDFLYE
jgi:hypothetical protein